MANNRMYLRCRACGEKFFLGKHFCQGWYLDNYNEDKGSIQDQLNAFYDKHIYCNGLALECFEIEYEDPEPSIWTNADRIRAMTDEELADELLSMFAGFYEVEWSTDDVLDWLKEEVKDG